MATTVTPGTMKVVIREELTLNGSDYTKEQSLSISGVTRISRRIMQVANGTWSQVIDWHGSGDDPETGLIYDANDVEYVRITNLDDTANILLNIEFESGKYIHHQVKPKCSFLAFKNTYDYSTTAGGADFASPGPDANFHLSSSSGTIHAEICVASS